MTFDVNREYVVDELANQGYLLTRKHRSSSWPRTTRSISLVRLYRE